MSRTLINSKRVFAGIGLALFSAGSAVTADDFNIEVKNDDIAVQASNASLQEIETLGNEMILAVREGIYQIIRVQGMTVLVLFMLGPKIIAWLGISDKFIHLYYIDLVGVAAQVLMLAVLNVLFYLDRLSDAFWLTLTLLITNSVFTWITLQMGPTFYGYGFGLSMTITAFVGIFLLSSELENIEFRTFMRPRTASA